ncbi:unnamed protein product [Arctia plantaginis]|uniref:Reverse transcriptase domain-containing protein n=1 Tax=Arctia plantaginis TaxID=874455 RepID=A0A8S1BCH9_ARCPL|nr:unnamed protein product [Arctia plantaginis]
MLIAAAIVADWPEEEEVQVLSDPEAQAVWFRGIMTDVCDASMPRVRPKGGRGSLYWWTPELEQLRTACSRARRQFQRTRRRRRATAEEIAERRREYGAAAKAISLAIAEAKARSWKELIEGLDRDPWGRPYKLVLGKLRPWVPPLTQTLDPEFVGRVVDTLFPRVQSSPSRPPSPSDPVARSDDFDVTEEELDRAVKRLTARNTAPGPDGIPGRAWGCALAVLGNRLRRLFTSCLRNSVFPAGWKEARLVLIQKPGRAADSPSAFRPICLLDEVAKLFERVIASRINQHLSRVGPDLSDNQFGFRQRRSTLDAIERVRSLSEEVVCRGGVALAVSLDIVNAFNSLPWWAIRDALVYHQLPPYLRDIIGAYLRDRSISYMGRDGEECRREVTCGVPQGSVLGPLLWNLAYDAVLRTSLPPGLSVVCYADDTLVLAGGHGFQEALELAEIGVACVVQSISGLGLRVAPHKTEALWFHRKRRGAVPTRSLIRVGGTEVEVGQHIKYLGLTLDSRWGFGEHFERMILRVRGVAGSLQRLLPNLGGPREEVRRLYCAVIRSMALYGAPIWAKRLSASSRCRAKLNQAQRIAAIRIVRGYRTISSEAATVLARFPPFDILADMDARVYDQTRAIRWGESGEGQDALEMRRNAHQHALVQWRVRLEQPQNARQRAVSAVLPNLEAWVGREGGRVTYRLTQVLTGHGCFGEYLNRIGREETAQCQHCAADWDSAQHTLEDCPAWASEREVLVGQIGRDLSPPAIIAAMLAGEEGWGAVVSFCEAVMLQKETAERDRERADPERRGRRRPYQPPTGKRAAREWGPLVAD